MPKTINQKIIFKATSAKDLYNLYVNAKLHSTVTGSSAKITEKEGDSFSSYDGYITGKNLQLIKDRLIVQSWRGSDWNTSDVDSTLIMYFETINEDVTLHVTHANVPDNLAEDINTGWHEFFWKPWKKYFVSKTRPNALQIYK